MGIRNLTTFIKNYYKNYWRDVCPRGGMVFDGHSLFYTMLSYSDIDWIHGGQYWRFRELMLDFFSSLEKSGIKPIVIMDGFDSTRKKEPVQISRMTDTAEALVFYLLEDVHPEGCNVIPMLIQETFVCILEEKGIPFYIADGEADPVTVAFANHYHCPIVGNDSDYFMFNIEYGYIPLENLEWKSQPVRAKMYKLTDFLDIFEINNVRLSRAIPAILKKEYTGIRPKGLFQLLIEEGIISTKPDYRIASLVRYISKVKSIEELVSHIRRTLDSGESIAAFILKNVKRAEKMYNITETISEDQLVSNTILVSSNGSKIPEWIISQYRKGQFSTNVLQGVVVGMCLSRAATDCPFKPSSLLVSQEIREAIYAILSSLVRDEVMTELVRWENSAILVRAKIPFSKLEFLPSLDSIPELSLNRRISLLCDVIGINSRVLESFDDQWKMVIAAACYWVKKCIPSHDMIEALVMSFLYCSTLERDALDSDTDSDSEFDSNPDSDAKFDSIADTYSDSKFDFNLDSDADPDSKFDSISDAEIDNLDDIFWSDIADAKLNSYADHSDVSIDFELSEDSTSDFDYHTDLKPTDFLKNLPNMQITPTWLETLHKFSAFQSIYHDISKLNDVFQLPLIFVSPALIFDGKLVMMYASHTARQRCFNRLVKKLMNSIEYDSFVNTLSSFL